jgi:hypothetical protein
MAFETTKIIAPGGKLVSLEYLDPSDIDIESVFKTLARQVRYNGNSDRVMTVLGHCLLTSQIAKIETENNQTPEVSLKLQILSLLHDASEAFIGDIITPIKHSRYVQGIEGLETLILFAILKSQGINFDSHGDFSFWMNQVKVYDKMALSLEVPVVFKEVHPIWKEEGYISEVGSLLQNKVYPFAFTGTEISPKIALAHLNRLKEKLKKAEQELLHPIWYEGEV